MMHAGDGAQANNNGSSNSMERLSTESPITLHGNDAKQILVNKSRPSSSNQQAMTQLPSEEAFQAPTSLLELLSMTASPDGLDDKLIQELQKIQELDKLLAEKTQLAKKLKMKRVSSGVSNRPSTTASITSSSETAGKQGPWSGPWKMLRYLRSLDHTDGSFEQQTFLTEPMFDSDAHQEEMRNQIPVPPPTLKQSQTKSTSSSKLNSSKKSKFIKRNMELGADARYFSSLTKDEQDRVDLIIQLLEIEAENQRPGSDSNADESNIETSSDPAHDSQPADPNSMASTLIRDQEKMKILDAYIHGYEPDLEDRQRLEEIERKLKRLIATTHTRLYSDQHADNDTYSMRSFGHDLISETDTAILFPDKRVNGRDADTLTSISSVRDVESIMSDERLLPYSKVQSRQEFAGSLEALMQEDLEHLKDIDKRLAELQNGLALSRPRSTVTEASMATEKMMTLDPETVKKLVQLARIEINAENNIKD